MISKIYPQDFAKDSFNSKTKLDNAAYVDTSTEPSFVIDYSQKH